MPAVAQLLREGWEVADGATVLVGENGSGKSTLVEAVAAAYPRWGAAVDPASCAATASTGTRPSGEDSPLGWGLRCELDPLASPGGFFFRAELMHAFLAAMDSDEALLAGFGGRSLQRRSHGEGFLAYLDRAAETTGLYLLGHPLPRAGRAARRAAARGRPVGVARDDVGAAAARAGLALLPALPSALAARPHLRRPQRHHIVRLGGGVRVEARDVVGATAPPAPQRATRRLRAGSSGSVAA